MRIIKFRAWIPQLRKMDNVTSLDWIAYDETEGKVDVDICTDSARVCDDDMVLMQYTGLKDKNGKEIYEGDIVSLINHDRGSTRCGESTKHTVSFQNGSFVIDWKTITGIAFENIGYHEQNSHEVIGNVFENKELLHDSE
jgi:uncharacterized phage protein (TIGR01671 family)